MAHEILILEKLSEIANKLDKNNLTQKKILNFKEACSYLGVRPRLLYKLTGTKQIPHFISIGKEKLFKRQSLDNWLQAEGNSSTPKNDMFVTIVAFLWKVIAVIAGS